MSIDTLRQIQTEIGAQLDDRQIPVTFGNEAAAIAATQTGVALVDYTHWGRLQISDADRLRFLHNQSTNHFEALKPGQGCETVFVNSTARTIDLATAYILEDSVLVLVSPNRRQPLLAWLDRYIFPFDKVKLKDITGEWATFSLLGPQSVVVLQQLGIDGLPTMQHHHQVYPFGDAELRIARGSGLTTPGFTVMVEIDPAATLWQALMQAGAVPMGTELWETLRIQQGRPAPDRELTEDYNPLEAGLWQTVSFDKGCYIGQETIARLNTYKGVKQRLWGLRLTGQAEPETVVMLGDDKVGKLTSVVQTDEGMFGLAYIRTKAGGEGLQVQVGDVEGEVVALSFVSHPVEDSVSSANRSAD